ncbi:MAG: EutN/CcmL family microcompartment protein [Ignavibacteriota bacterium]|mgnify:FL=1|jgi:microcompartment protein CcmK/EutM|nr:ethanolamine utilization microcompartment protein EutN [Ignavibacteriota bacterium]MBW7842139.1 EutN/CcmL family microcompartment protein [Ignavibacterium sp.]MCO6449009.1 EutN/CcmL family microcompartment protein [Ignavibacterium album]MCZ2268339.1 EutN/CcmL family microcompartment protein [Ignavibacteriales bacterium]MDX9713082.1 EutN/CcmL family microcompartment protein [Ignavibacteriaceae bacterium]
MELAKVIGNVVATVKIENLGAGKLLLVKSIDENGIAVGNPQVALDTIGAGEEEIVLLVRGSSARVSLSNKSSVDLNVVGIVDNIRSNGKVVYIKNEPILKE